MGGRDNIIFYVKYRYRPLRVPVLGFYLYSVLQLVSLSCTSKITNLCVSGPSSAYSTPHHHHTLSSPAYPGGSDEATSTRAVVVSSTYTPSSTPIQTPPEVSAASALLPVTASPSPPTPLSSSSPEGFTPSYTPRYTPSYTPAHQPSSRGATPLYSGPSSSSPEPSPLYSPGNATPLATYSPAHYDPADVHVDGTAAGYSPSGGPAYSPSAPYYSPAPSPGYSPSSAGGLGSSPHQNYYSPHTPSYSPTQGAPGSSAHSPSGGGGQGGPLYSPGNATPATSQVSNDSPPVATAAVAAATPAGYSPSIQGCEVSGNTTPHPGLSDSPLNSPGPRYSWSGGSQQPSGRNTPLGAAASGVLQPSVGAALSPGPSAAENNFVSTVVVAGGTLDDDAVVGAASPQSEEPPVADSPSPSSN